MLFNSFIFFALFVPVLVLYWCVSRQSVRLVLLLAASLIFYGYHHWPSVFLLLFTIAFNFIVGKAQGRLRSKRLLVVAVMANLSLLLWFKYAAFVANTINDLLALIGAHLEVPVPPVFLPLGISFFTFQVVAYQVDVYRREIEAETSWLRFAVFKCFFPQLIAGPIVRAKDFLPQLRERVRFDPAVFHQGLWLLMAGMALKIGVADVLAQFADEAFRAPNELSAASAWAGLYAYAFQLYADFWGYSTMAVGIAAMFGLVLPLNFDTPYASASLQEFWRRWHITLSVWFRDYVYIPLGGNRGSQALNLILTMSLAGLWHGAGWPFVIWGVAHGVWLAVERHVPTLPTKWRWLKTLIVFHGVCLLWVLFRAPTLQVAGDYYAHLFSGQASDEPVAPVLINWLVVFALLQWPIAWTFKEQRFTKLALPLQWLLGVLCITVVLAYAGARVDFIYFNF